MSGKKIIRTGIPVIKHYQVKTAKAINLNCQCIATACKKIQVDTSEEST